MPVPVMMRCWLMGLDLCCGQRCGQRGKRNSANTVKIQTNEIGGIMVCVTVHKECKFVSAHLDFIFSFFNLY